MAQYDPQKEALDLLDDVLSIIVDNDLESAEDFLGDEADRIAEIQVQRDQLVRRWQATQEHPAPSVFTRRRHVQLTLMLDTNMDPAELGGLIEGLAISIREFGKEHLDMPRYEEVVLYVRDGSFTVPS